MWRGVAGFDATSGARYDSVRARTGSGEPRNTSRRATLVSDQAGQGRLLRSRCPPADGAFVRLRTKIASKPPLAGLFAGRGRGRGVVRASTRPPERAATACARGPGAEKSSPTHVVNQSHPAFVRRVFSRLIAGLVDDAEGVLAVYDGLCEVVLGGHQQVEGPLPEVLGAD